MKEVANWKNRPLKKPSVQQIAPNNRNERLHLTIHIALYSYHFNRAPHPSHKLPLVTNVFRLRFLIMDIITNTVQEAEVACLTGLIYHCTCVMGQFNSN